MSQKGIKMGRKCALTCADDGFSAYGALVRKLVTETLSTVGFLLTNQERGACQLNSALIAGEAGFVPRFILEHDTVLHNNLQLGRPTKKTKKA